MKLKKSVKDNLMCIGLILLLVVGLSALSVRNKQLDKKMTEMSGIQISQSKY